jgi:hypothetical protein
MRRILPVAIAPVLFACPDDSPTTCFVGDRSLPPQIEVVYRDVDNTMQPLSEGGEVPLILPPQGGKVMVVGVRARNLDGCPLEIATSIRDTCSNAIVALERRPITLEPTADGWLEPLAPADLTNYSNLPACPRANLDRDVHGQPYVLTIRVTDKENRTAETMLEIVPTCAEPQFMDQCLCECRSDYSLGDECTGERPDAGVSGTCDAG